MIVASAAPVGPRVCDPLKITSDMSLPRRLLGLWLPKTHFIASTMFDFPEPLGPTMTVIPSGNSNRVRSAKLLKPASSSALSIQDGSAWFGVDRKGRNPRVLG